MSLKILLVDDDEMILFLHKMVIETGDLHPETICFTNGKEALEYLDTHQLEGDNYLILLDINMPVMDGWSFLDYIQTKVYTAGIAVVMVSSSTNLADRNRAFQFEQVLDYIEKPMDDEIWNTIMQLPHVANLKN